MFLFSGEPDTAYVYMRSETDVHWIYGTKMHQSCLQWLHTRAISDIPCLQNRIKWALTLLFEHLKIWPEMLIPMAGSVMLELLKQNEKKQVCGKWHLKTICSGTDSGLIWLFCFVLFSWVFVGVFCFCFWVFWSFSLLYGIALIDVNKIHPKVFVVVPV